MNTRRYFPSLFVLIIFLLVSPANASQLVPSPGKSLLVAKSDPILHIPPRFVDVKSTRFEKLDGKIVKERWKNKPRIEVTPGNHSISLSCEIRYGEDGLVYGKKTFDLEIKEGKTYIFYADFKSEFECKIEYRIE